MNASPLLILALEARLNAGRDIFSQHKRVERQRHTVRCQNES